MKNISRNMWNRIVGIFLIMITLTTLILFVLSSSELIWVSSTFNYDLEGQDNFTIQNPNLLLGNKYMIIAGNEFTAYVGFIDVDITIMNIATRENQTFQFYIDATNTYISWGLDHHVVILIPGDYTIFWQMTPITVKVYIFSHGWFMKEEPYPDRVNKTQPIILIFLGASGALGAIVVLLVYIKNVEDRNLKIKINKDLKKKVYKVIDPKIPLEIRTGNFELAIKNYSEASNKKDQALKLFQSAQNDIRTGNLEDAIQRYCEIIKLLPNLKEALFERGSLYAKFGLLLEALRDFDELVRKYPFFAAGWYNKSIVLNKLGRYEEAREAIEMVHMLK